MRTVALTSLFFLLLLLSRPVRLQAGCGCDKPPPVPAAVIPSVAFSGMSVTLFHDSFQPGQSWTVAFRNEAASTSIEVSSVVVAKRALFDPPDPQSVPTLHAQLNVTVPTGLPPGPTQIVAFAGADSFTVPAAAFTVIGKPVVVSEQTGNYSVKNYVTGVGADGTLYVSLGGLNNVCQPMEFRAFAKGYPLRFADGGVVVSNIQGFLIDAFDQQSAGTFWVQPLGAPASDRVAYFRHSFEQYCIDHQPGGLKEVDPQDPNWHLDGTAHTDYSTLILAINGHLADGTVPPAGQVSFDLKLQTKIGDHNQIWALERNEESIGHRHK